jgi:DNA-3-methyladenine glycosylase II
MASTANFTQHLQQAAAHLSRHDSILATIISVQPLPTFRPHSDYYNALVSSIISQQLSVKAAATIKQRFLALFGDRFPTPEEIIEKDAEDLRKVGLSYRKVEYIKDLALHILDGKIVFDEFDGLTNEEIIKELVAVKGIGEWTVHMFLMFCMGRLDVLPTGDLGIRNGMLKYYNLEALPSPAEMQAIAENNSWKSYETIASWYLWRALDNAPA